MYEFLIKSKLCGDHWVKVSDVDKEDFSEQDGIDWSKQWKLVRNKGKMTIYRKTRMGQECLTKFLTGLNRVEHIDGDCFNFQRENLRKK